MKAPLAAGQVHIRRVSRWTAIVIGCALPLLVTIWPGDTVGTRLGMLLGVMLWIALALRFESRLGQFEPGHRVRMLRTGAMAFLVLQGIGAAIFRAWFLFFLYAPIVLMAGSFPLRLAQRSDFLNGFVLTMVSGAEALLLALVLGWLVERGLQRRAD